MAKKISVSIARTENDEKKATLIAL